jgi:hypothetical protein
MPPAQLDIHTSDSHMLPNLPLVHQFDLFTSGWACRLGFLCTLLAQNGSSLFPQFIDMKNLIFFFACYAIALAALGQTYNWSVATGGPTFEYATATTADAAGNYYMTGGFEDSLDIDPSAGSTMLFSTNDLYMTDIFLAKYDGAGALLWGFSLGGSKSDEGSEVVTDAAGNVYLCGEFSGTVDFDPGVGVTNLSSSFYGGQMFVAKYSPSGNLIWARHIASITFGDNGATQVALDGSGNVYMQGYFQGTIDLDPGTAVVSAGNAGGGICIVKLDAAGNYVWGLTAGNGILPNGMDVDANGNVVVCGEMFYASDMDPSVGVANHQPAGLSDIYIAKYSSAGAYLWSHNMGSANTDNVDTELGREVHFLPNGDVALFGQFRGTFDADPGATTLNKTSAGGSDVFITRFDANGGHLWTQTYGNSTDEWAVAMDADAAGNLYLACTMFGTYDLDPGAGMINFSNMDASPTILTIAGSGAYLGHYRTLRESGIYRLLTDLCITPSGGLLLAGRFDYEVNCDSALAPIHKHICVGGTDLILAYYGPTVVTVRQSFDQPGLNISPNPVSTLSSTLHVRCDQPLLRLQLVSLKGEVMRAWDGENQLMIDLPLEAGIAAGMYLLQVETATGATVQRVLLQ